MLSKTKYIIKQTENVNMVAESYGNLVGKVVMISMSQLSSSFDIRVYIIDEKDNGHSYGPILGLTMDDLEIKK